MGTNILNPLLAARPIPMHMEMKRFRVMSYEL
jgi:hypothetical protein